MKARSAAAAGTRALLLSPVVIGNQIHLSANSPSHRPQVCL